ncbi:sugar transferase [Thermonema rossianum]|uniref:sugar transferase n=1 Tax=Thermonema rossianum TaxID=55505 RepID=UPI000570B936|nr:sugar transferase [Thermonema rossianum]
MGLYARWVKPFFDYTAALALAILLMPLFFLLTLCLTVYWRGNPFFCQLRIGRNERPFYLLKFKTMRPARAGEDPHDENRATAVGRLLRDSGLDELPQLWNILRGDMSFVGPRPLLPEYLPRYSPAERQRHAVKPGITGWAQIQGGKALAWNEKMHYDIEYVQRQSFCFDLYILWRTPFFVLRQWMNRHEHI